MLKYKCSVVYFFQADVHAVSDGCNAVKYNLTADVMQAIFKTYPSGTITVYGTTFQL